MIIGGMIDSPKERDMPNDLTDGVGFVSPDVRTGAAKRRFARAELIATVALAVCLVVALTAVSIGMARADTLGIIAETENGRLALAIMLGLIMVGMGGVTALMSASSGKARPD
jgi:hypothetical protein